MRAAHGMRWVVKTARWVRSSHKGGEAAGQTAAGCQSRARARSAASLPLPASPGLVRQRGDKQVGIHLLGARLLRLLRLPPAALRCRLHGRLRLGGRRAVRAVQLPNIGLNGVADRLQRQDAAAARGEVGAGTGLAALHGRRRRGMPQYKKVLFLNKIKYIKSAPVGAAHLKGSSIVSPISFTPTGDSRTGRRAGSGSQI